MTDSLALTAGPPVVPRGRRPAGAWRGLSASVGMHALVLGCIAGWTMLWWHRLPQPGEPPSVDVVVDGGGAAETGAPAAEPAPPSPPTPPMPVAAAPPPPAAPAAQPPPADPPAQAAPPVPPPPQDAGLTPVPPAAPTPPAAPPPGPEPPPATEPPAPAQIASLTPPPAPQSEGSPEVRLGDGTSGPLAELLNEDGLVRRAKAGNGNIPPTYPLAAARRGEHGTVTLRLTIGTDGSVLEAEVAKSSGSPRLDRAARDQIATWHFSPAMRGGKPQIDIIELGVDFVLD